jgi:hypothetical protein
VIGSSLELDRRYSPIQQVITLVAVSPVAAVAGDG